MALRVVVCVESAAERRATTSLIEGAGHAVRACRATVLMRRVLRKAGRIEIPGARASLRMSQGVHSARFHFFAAGSEHLELLPTGPAWSDSLSRHVQSPKETNMTVTYESESAAGTSPPGNSLRSSAGKCGRRSGR